MYPASFDGLQLMTNNNAHYSQWSPPVFNCQCPYRIVAKPDQIKLCFTSRKLYFDIKSITGPANADMVRLLLAAGARTADKDNMGRTAETFAKRRQHDETIELLHDAGK